MTGHNPTREEAWAILSDHVKNPSLLHHALAVEAVMRHIARKRGADDEMWGVIGLIHDLDYEEHPDEHLRHAPEILRSHGWPEEHVRAVLQNHAELCVGQYFAYHALHFDMIAFWHLYTQYLKSRHYPRFKRYSNKPEALIKAVVIFAD